MAALTDFNLIQPESLVDMPGDTKLEVAIDERNPSTVDFFVYKEDHTLANLLRMQLHKDQHVRFAGYKTPHPTQHNFILKVQTAPDGSGDTVPRPHDSLMTAVDDLIGEVAAAEKKFADAVGEQ